MLWLVILFSLPETLRARVGNGAIDREEGVIFFPPRPFSKLAPESERGPPPPRPTLTGFWRLFRYPPIGVVSFNTAILYAAYFSIAVELPTALEEVYHWSSSAVGAGYLAVGVAMVLGSTCGGRFSDARRARAVKARGANGVPPENRIIDQIWGVFPFAGGTLMFGWFIGQSVHPAAVIVSTFLSEFVRFIPDVARSLLTCCHVAGFGMSWIIVTANAFLTECVPQQAAGVFALGNMLRNPAAAIAAAIIHPLVVRMGWGWCFSGLAFLNFFVVGTAIFLLRVKPSQIDGKVGTEEGGKDDE